MRILITGASGQLGDALLRTAPGHADINAIDADDVDFTDLAMLRARLVVEAPEIIINAAAYTDLHAAEIEEGLARAINADAVAVLVEAMAESGGKLVHVSCNCVFDGAATHAYRPEDTPTPLSALGRSKAAGEACLRPQDLLVRTSWLYEAGGTNFARAMIVQMREGRAVVAARDEISSPTWATGLARTLWALVEQQARGTFHHTDAGVVSRYEFARAIAEEALALGLIDQPAMIRPVMAGESEAGPDRQRFSLLDCSATRAFLGTDADEWRAALRLMLQAEARLG